MKKLIVIVFVLFAAHAFAQKQHLIVEGVTPNLYLTHIVAPKEGLYSLGRLYNQAPKAIAAFNQTTLERGLAIGQTIKIPLNTMNYDVTGVAQAGETLLPVYHVVSKNETLFRIGNNHAAQLTNLRQWNKLASDVIEVGTPLVVGHIKIKTDQVTAFNNIVSPQVAATPQAAAATTPTPSIENQAKPVEQKPVLTEAKIDKPVEEKPAPQKEQTPAVKADTPVEKPAGAIAIPVDTAKEMTNPSAVLNNDVPVKKEEAVAVKEEPPVKKEEVVVPVKVEPAAKPAVEPVISNSVVSDEGAFAGFYTAGANEKSVANKTGEAGTFKSTSGWQDKKYYVLINDVMAGTILRITSGNKSIYAKVLGGLPDMKDNNGLLLRLSNAAASYLGNVDPKFTVQVSYYQ